MLRRLLNPPMRWLVGLPQAPAIRYSASGRALQRFFAYTDKERMLHEALDCALFNRVEGDYLEFGVGAGKSFVAAYHLAQSLVRTMPHAAHMRFCGFDSFVGLPQIYGVDSEEGRPFNAGDHEHSLEDVQSFLDRQGVSRDRTRLVPGWFDGTLTSATKRDLGLSKASVVFVDVDLYVSTVPVLEFITDLVQDGTVLILDEWFVFRGSPDHGEQLALREWLKRRPELQVVELIRYGWHGMSFIVRRQRNIGDSALAS